MTLKKRAFTTKYKYLNKKGIRIKIRTTVFKFVVFSILSTPIIHAAFSFEEKQELLEAVKNGNLGRVQKFIEGGMDPNTADNRRKTLLILASDRRDGKMVKFLLERKANHDSQDHKGSTALIWASFKGNDEVIKLLLPYSNLDLEDTEGQTALMLASFKKNYKIVQLLLPRSNLDSQNKQGKTALMLASFKGNYKIVQLLFPCSNLDLRNKLKQTALDMTVDPSIRKMISEEMNRRKKITAKIPPFLQEAHGVPPEIAEIILKMEGAKPSE